MGKLLCCLWLLTASPDASTDPLAASDFDRAEDAQAWNHKSNTTITASPADPFEGAGAMRFTIDPTEFSYGWVHSGLPDADFTKLEGIAGVFRASRGAHGQIVSHICLRGQGDELSYFKADLGFLRDSNGEWVEFCVPLSGFRYELGPIRAIKPTSLNPADLIQFLVQLEGREPVSIDIDSVRFLNAEDAAPVAERVGRAECLRLLLPDEEVDGRPHARLLLTEERLPHLRAKAKTGDERQEAYERLVSLAEGLLTSYDAADPMGPVYGFVETSELEGVPWRAAFEGQLLSCSYPIEVLGAAYRLTGDERFGRHAARALVNAASRLTYDESAINRGFYYSITFYVRALAFGYDWLWDLLNPDDRRTVKATLLGFVRDIRDKSLSQGWGRRPLNRVWNWDPGLMGACGVGMLALEGETRLAEQAVLFECRRHLRDYLTLGIDADGCGHEGPSYLGYGIGAGVEFADALRQQGRGDLFVETNYHLLVPWLISETLPDGRRWNNLSDCGHGQRAWPVYLYACGRLHELAQGDPTRQDERWNSPTIRQPLGYLQQFAEAPGPRRLSYGAMAGLLGWVWPRSLGRASPSEYDARAALAHVLFYEPLPEVADPAQYLALGLHFRGRGLVVCRTGFGPEDLHLAVEAGPYAAGHDQCDKGTFTLRGYGADLAIDSGYGNDGDPQKSHSSYAHNIVLTDGQGQPISGHNRSSGHVTGFHHSDLLDWVRVDAKDAWSLRYDADWRPIATTPVARANRSFLFVRPSAGVPPYLVIWDDIANDDEAHDYTWQWHIPAGMVFDLADGIWTARPRPAELPALTTTPDAPSASATFRLVVRRAGRYLIYGLTRAGGPEVGKSDSFFVTVDDGDRILWDLRTGADLAWNAVADRTDESPRAFALAAGEHTIRLEMRETQAELARWLVMPEGTEAPVEPEETPEGAIAISIDKAAQGDPPFTRLEAGRVEGPSVTMDVFAVNPAGGKVETGWFETSREGSHPRLQYTVNAANPDFVAVLVPRAVQTPRPAVEALRGDGGVGVTVRWPEAIDTVLFSREAAKFGDAGLQGSAAFLRHRGDELEAWALLDGALLRDGDRQLVQSDQPVVRAESVH